MARIRHYALKSKEEFSRKQNRGDGFYLPEEKPRHATYWIDCDLNEIYDPADPKLLDSLKALFQDLLKLIS